MQNNTNEITFKEVEVSDSFGFIQQYLEYAVEDNLISETERFSFTNDLTNSVINRKTVLWKFKYQSNAISEADKRNYGCLSFNRFPGKYLNSVHIFGLDTEGWSPIDLDIPKYLHEGFFKETGKLDHIFFVTGNLNQKKYYDDWVAKNNFKHKINIVEICNWDTYRSLEANSQIEESEFTDETIPDYRTFFYSRKDKLSKTYRKEKYFIYLNRRTRPHRTYLTTKIYHDELRRNTILSHDKISNEDEFYIIDTHKNLLTEEKLELFSEKLKTMRTPLIADIDNFEKNYANEISEGIHSNALISVVGETMQDDHDNTSMFFSEKTFRPILLGQPFLIWGQYECHNWLFNKLGYKPYNKLFNYEFDSIKDIPSRADALFEELKRVANILRDKSKVEQIEWVNQDYDALKYNLMRMRYNEFSMRNFLRFKDDVKKLF